MMAATSGNIQTYPRTIYLVVLLAAFSWDGVFSQSGDIDSTESDMEDMVQIAEFNSTEADPSKIEMTKHNSIESNLKNLQFTDDNTTDSHLDIVRVTEVGSTESHLDLEHVTETKTTESDRDLEQVTEVKTTESDLELEQDMMGVKTTESDLELLQVTEVHTTLFETTTTPSSPLVEIPDTTDPANLQMLVKSLMTELKESRTSQANTRSVLNLIQEKQLSQEQDLAILKGEITVIRKAQQKDRDTLVQLNSMVSNNNWAMIDLKTGQTQLKVDFSSVKKEQQNQNETMREIEDITDQTKELHKHYQMSLRSLQTELRHIRTSMYQDRRVINQIKEVISGANKNIQNSNSSVDTHKPNQIPVFSSSESSDSTENSGDGSRIDTIASELEEKDNHVGRNLMHIIQRGTNVKKDMDTLQAKSVHTDAEISKMYAMFLNLSLQVSTLENRFLVHQQQRYENDFGEIQRSFVNFTQHLFQLEQVHTYNKVYANTSEHNQKDIKQMNNILENHTNRIKTVEQLILDYRSINQHNSYLISTQLAQVNQTMQDYRALMATHKTKALDNFEDFESKILEFDARINDNDNRLVRVEVKVLNATLQQCEKGNTDLVQDNRLIDFNSNLNKVQETMDLHDGQVNRLDSGLSRLYKDVQVHAKTLVETMEQTKTLLHVVPDVTMLQQEVRNLISTLPKDCAEIETENIPDEGVFVIRPENSARSVQAYCEHNDDGDWTLIQRRIDGAVSFGRNWDEYKYGFGFPDKEFWIGNDNIHYLSSQGSYLLHLDMWDVNDQYWVAEYDYFRVESESDNYRLHIDGYQGNATDAMRYSNFMPFSTIDKDNDVSSTHCAKFYTSGWWYKHCHYSNLNGRHTVGIVWFNHDYDEWSQMKKTVMKIKPINSTAVLVD